MGAFVGIGAIAFYQTYFLSREENIFLIGSFGASSVLVYGAIQSPLSQPRNLVGGHLISAIAGVAMYKIFPDILWLAVSFSIVLMQITKTLHPPGGATALIAVIGTEKIKIMGFWYALSPVLTGCLILLLVALIFNNMTANRVYPSNSRFTRYIMRKRKMGKNTG